MSAAARPPAPPIERRTCTCKLASVLLQYPTATLVDGLGRAGALPRRPHLAASRDALARFLRWLRRDAADRGRAALRGDVRPAPPVRAVPDLLPVRRHPQARDGHAELQGRLPGRRAPAARRRAARLPADGAGLRRLAPAWHGAAAQLTAADLELLRRALDEAGPLCCTSSTAVCAELPEPAPAGARTWSPSLGGGPPQRGSRPGTVRPAGDTWPGPGPGHGRPAPRPYPPRERP